MRYSVLTKPEIGAIIIKLSERLKGKNAKSVRLLVQHEGSEWRKEDSKRITEDMIKTKTLKKSLTNHIKSDIIDKLFYGTVWITERKF